jgi:hypothetical protein
MTHPSPTRAAASGGRGFRIQPGNQNPIRSRPDDSFRLFPAESGKETSATIAARPEKRDSFVEIQAVMKE